MKKNNKYPRLVLQLTLFMLISIVIFTMFVFSKEETIDSIFTNSLVIYELLIVSVFLAMLLFMFLFSKNDKDAKKVMIENDIAEDKVTNSKVTNDANDDIEEPSEANEIAVVKKTEVEYVNINIDTQNVYAAFLRSEERLNNEIRAVGKRANINMIIGSVIAILGWGLLLWFVIDVSKMGLYKWQLLNAFIPRFSIVLFIELFSYFFLRLYHESLDRIKYYQNELTNIESRKIAILACLAIDENSGQKAIVIEHLLKIERNSIYKKGETSLELEKVRRESQISKSVLESIREIVKILKTKEG